MVTRFLTAGAMLALAALPAAAADLSSPSIVQVPAAETPLAWSGVYFGAQAGYGWGGTDFAYAGGLGAAAPSGTAHPDGIVGGIYAGFNAQSGSLVFGVEADAGLADVSGGYADRSGISSQGSARIDWDASLRARFGAAFGRSLVYATGGVAVAGYDFKGGPAGGSRICCGFSETLTGWTIGAGTEYALTTHLMARLEYRYTDYGNASGALKPSYPTTRLKTDNTASTVRVGLGYKF